MDEFFVDDILQPKMKKKVNAVQKGKRVERALAKVLTEKFGDTGFSRTIGSGNRWAHVASLPQHAQDTFTGDLVCPENFAFTVESKGGYEAEIDLNSILFNGNARFNGFLEQAEHESNQSGRKPLILWKRSRKPWLSIIKTEDLPHLDWEYRLLYKDWSMIPLDSLLTLPNEFFYEEKSS
ncbi:MAG: hypothetical protein GTO02_00815 [Candidatus Dadabacteria bacterium]|nr:hypothetical protein [Candidatus Dadabacteria bacterium]